MSASPAATSAYTAIALVAFASNSILCRLALGAGTIDPASFTAIRLLSGAAMLLPLAAATGPGRWQDGNWTSALALGVYAVTFSYAYVSLDVSTGALLLFGSVQATMIGVALYRGDRAPLLEWVGLAGALAGLLYLVSPGLTAPPAAGAALMALSGVAWGAYSLRGRSTRDARWETAGNFARTLPIALVFGAPGVLGTASATVSPAGLGLAIASGALASGLGYVVWYAALRGLSAIRAATVQLAVPIVAAAGGAILLGEVVSLRVVGAGLLILGGVGLAVSARGFRRPPASVGV